MSGRCHSPVFVVFVVSGQANLCDAKSLMSGAFVILAVVADTQRVSMIDAHDNDYPAGTGPILDIMFWSC